MEATPKRKFVCKFCNKRYPCGKSLGGHIRIHFNGNGNSATDLDQETAAAAKLEESSNGGEGQQQSKRESLEAEAAGRSGYGLRENPRKTKRFVLDSNNTKLLQEKVCKECGKGFQSLKALCGHMACHSKTSFEDHSGTNCEKVKEVVMDGQSDTETSTPSKGRRSKRIMRYKTIGVYSSSYGSLSSASDVEQEQEEVAMSLMMLSRDSGFKGCFSFVADSSDNNSSVVLEAKSSSTKMRISVKNGANFVFKGQEFLEMKKSKQRELLAIVDDHSDNSDSGYFRKEPKNVESDISVHGFTKNHEFKKQKVEFGSRRDDDHIDTDTELGKRLSSFRHVKAKLGRGLIEEDGYDPFDRASLKHDSSKRIKDESCSSEFRARGSAQRKGKYSSPLDGHRSSRHRRTNNGGSDSIYYESGENSVDDDYSPSPLPTSSKKIKSCSGKSSIVQNKSSNGEKKLVSKKRKLHECPFCNKVFQSGQALGGHKRSHFVGVGEDRTLVINQQVAEIPMAAPAGLIDLNLPAPVEEEANGYMPW